MCIRDRPWGTFLDVKHWKPIDNPHKYDGQRIVIGSVTDGYHPYEEDFCRTRKLLEELKGTKDVYKRQVLHRMVLQM